MSAAIKATSFATSPAPLVAAIPLGPIATILAHPKLTTFLTLHHVLVAALIFHVHDTFSCGIHFRDTTHLEVPVIGVVVGGGGVGGGGGVVGTVLNLIMNIVGVWNC